MTDIKLTQYSHGAGCGCKISPSILTTILKSQLSIAPDENLIVGNQTRDDAAVYDLSDGTGVISTTDFFMPIADDPFDFGRIAAANAISDVYAMGGDPLMAIAILGWPINKLDASVAQKVIDGGRSICAEANIPLAGGHSIDSPEPIFGLAVTGRVDLVNLKRNDTAKEGDVLYLTKPLGIGILTTAQKQQKLKPNHSHLAIDVMCKLNSIGAQLAKRDGVTAMTDVTGFGLLGHLIEMCEGANLGAKLDFSAVPIIDAVMDYQKLGCIPGGGDRNFESYGQKVGSMSDVQRQILSDPQTSGGLLFSVEQCYQAEIESFLKAEGYYHQSIGRFVKSHSEKCIELI